MFVPGDGCVDHQIAHRNVPVVYWQFRRVKSGPTAIRALHSTACLFLSAKGVALAPARGHLSGTSSMIEFQVPCLCFLLVAVTLVCCDLRRLLSIRPRQSEGARTFWLSSQGLPSLTTV